MAAGEAAEKLGGYCAALQHPGPAEDSKSCFVQLMLCSGIGAKATWPGENSLVEGTLQDKEPCSSKGRCSGWVRSVAGGVAEIVDRVHA